MSLVPETSADFCQNDSVGGSRVGFRMRGDSRSNAGLRGAAREGGLHRWLGAGILRHTPKFHCHDARSADPAGSSGFGLGVPGGCGRQSRSSPLAGLYGGRFQVLTPPLTTLRPPPSALLVSYHCPRLVPCDTIPPRLVFLQDCAKSRHLLSPSSGHCRILFFPTAPRPQGSSQLSPRLVLVFA